MRTPKEQAIAECIIEERVRNGLELTEEQAWKFHTTQYRALGISHERLGRALSQLPPWSWLLRMSRRLTGPRL